MWATNYTGELKPHTEQTTERGKPTTTHPQQQVCGHVRSWPGGSKEKPANDEGRTVRVQTTTRQPEYATNKKTPNDATTNHCLNHKKPPPNEPPLPETTTCAPPLNRNPPKPRQKTTRATRTTHPPKGCIGFQGCPSVPTTCTNRESKTPDPPDKTWEQGCTTQDARNARRNHTPASAGVYHAPRMPQTNHTPAAAEAETRHAKNTPWMKPSNGNARHEAAGAPNEPRTRFGGYLHCAIPHPMRFETNMNWVCGNTCPQTPATDATPGKAPGPLQKIMPETGWAAV
ncbi:hypothetical protein BS47DRAFT_1366383 [Hydnum rufescens UP504]|uniref:Uncharacterized protein n=1 Tax=Hydnum rufescens UP504 TaxID=1448309 RepID=A0A9P6AL71_9AGAM|nr:hypothetical protein BS47DRAFT_1366383 [Hydnum rufescens UP504]